LVVEVATIWNAGGREIGKADGSLVGRRRERTGNNRWPARRGWRRSIRDPIDQHGGQGTVDRTLDDCAARVLAYRRLRNGSNTVTAAVTRSRNDVEPNVVGNRQVMSGAVGGYQRIACAERLETAVELDDLRARVALETFLHDSVRHTGHRIPNHVVGEWKLIARLPMILVLLRPASRLRKAKIGIGLARARNDREHAVEHFVAARVVIESAP